MFSISFIRYKLSVLIVFFTGTGAIGGYTQEQERIWAFGRGAGIDFNTNPPTPIVTGISTSEGSASVCDENGRLLFYTDGTYVWSRNNTVMPNGVNLTGAGSNITASTTQGALIVLAPGKQDQYYIFSLGQYGGSYTGKLYYSIVDMTLNSGWGDVTTKGKLFDSLLTEHMTAVSGNECNIWLLVLSRSDTTLKAFNINADGINPKPVVSGRVAGGGLYSGILGSIDVSPDRRKLAIAQGSLVLYNFDIDAGKITQPLVLDLKDILYSDGGYYGVCFSPDNTKLYGSTSMDLNQFDISLTNDAIINSKTRLGPQSYGAIKRGPDGKVYSARLSTGFLNVINQPNLAGAACQFVINGFSLAAGTSCQFGLPNLGTIFTYKRISSTTKDSTLCSGARTLKAADRSGLDYVWEDSTLGSVRTVANPGTYWVRYMIPVNTPCKYESHIDTFKVVFRFPTTDVYTTTTDSGMCKTDTILMQAGNFNGVSYTWEDGSTGRQRKVNQTGIYWVSYEVDSLCENYVDTFVITYPDPEYKASFKLDTLLCQEQLISFPNTSDQHFNNFYWSFGDGHFSELKSPQYAYAHPGTYRLMLTGHIDNVCPDTAFQIITVDLIFPTRFFTDRDSICTGESIYFETDTDSTVASQTWQFGDDSRLVSLSETNMRHAYSRSGIFVVTLAEQFRACPDDFFTDTVYVFDVPLVYLGEDSGLCLNGVPILLKNRALSPVVAYHQLWSTGDTTETLKVVYPGTYSLTVSTEPMNCSTMESVTIHKDCYTNIPNAFTPNGDGYNDYFFPKQLLSKKVDDFIMRIYNRWGQLLFETMSATAQGWDGRYNGCDQPGGTYVYQIELKVNGREEVYQGTVALLR